MQLEELQAIWETQTERPRFSVNDFGLHLALYQIRERDRRRLFWGGYFPAYVGSLVGLVALLLFFLAFYFKPAANDFPMNAWDGLVFLVAGVRLVLGASSMFTQPPKTREGTKRVRSFPAAGNRTRHRSNRLRDLSGNKQGGLAIRRALLSRHDTLLLGSRASERRSPAVERLMDDRPAHGRDVGGPGARKSAGHERGAAAQTACWKVCSPGSTRTLLDREPSLRRTGSETRSLLKDYSAGRDCQFLWAEGE